MNCDDIMKAHQSEHEKNTASVPLSTKQPGNLASFEAMRAGRCCYFPLFELGTLVQ
jgi:hypothetical protein